MAARKSNSVLPRRDAAPPARGRPVVGVVARRDRPPGRPELRDRALHRQRARGERSPPPPSPHPCLHARSRAHRARRGGARAATAWSTTRSRRWSASRATSGSGCLASARVGDDMVMLAVTGPPQPFGSRVQVGERVPIAPPLGLAFIAWADAATIEDYLDLSGRKLTAAERRQYVEALALVRERGYGVVLDSSTRHRLMERLRRHRLDDSASPRARRGPRRARARRLRAAPWR